MKIGFDKNIYMERQKKHIVERIEQFGGKLYMEFGGKLFDDHHAARVLPGFDVGGKIQLLYELREMAEITEVRPELIQKYIPVEPEFVCYLDVDQDAVLC